MPGAPVMLAVLVTAALVLTLWGFWRAARAQMLGASFRPGEQTLYLLLLLAALALAAFLSVALAGLRGAP